MPNPWTCEHCRAEQTHEIYCEACDAPRYASWEIAFAERILEHVADGVGEPLEVLKLMQARPCYAKTHLTLQKVTSTMRMLSKDTRQLARQIADAHAARMMLDVVHNGDAKDKIAVLKGRQVLGDVVEHKGDIITRHVVELHEGPPPKRDA